jgi:two-component system LytT family response regulator
MKIRALIADDEPPARERVRHLLREHTDIEIAAECSDGLETVAAVAKHAPDLLFLDVQMPGLDGFGVLSALPPDKLPVVIFTTAYDQHAVRAFDAHALDYLLKPFKPARFKEAVQRARDHLAGKNAGAQAQNLIDLLSRRATPHLTRITVKSGEKVIFVRVRDIECIESAGNYVVVFAGGQQHVLRETLTDLETQLDPANFLRISRSALVNLNHVKELQPLFKGDHAVILHSGKSLPMTRGLREVEKALRFG